MKRVTCVILSLLLMGLVFQRGAESAPGDQVARITPPHSCISASSGLAFDGQILYFSQWSDPAKKIYMVEASTGTDRGSFVPMNAGSPVGMGGLAWDTNRGILWGGADQLYRIDPITGTILAAYALVDSFGNRALAYDPLLDTLWASDSNSGRTTTCYRSDGLLCGNRNLGVYDQGLTSDGVDMWEITGADHPPELPIRGFLFPSGLETPVIDFSRAFKTAHREHKDAAFDCVTFSVPVVWVSEGLFGCDLIAYEVASRAPQCIQAPGPRIVRAKSDQNDPAVWRTLLPLTSAKADGMWRSWTPLAFVDPTVRLYWDDHPFIVYRALGDGDAPQGNILKIVKDPTRRGVIIKE